MNWKNCKPLLPLLALYVAGAVMLMVVEANEEAERLQQVEEIVLQVCDKPYIPAENAAEEAAPVDEEPQFEEEYSYYPTVSYYDSEYDDLSDRDYIAQRESGQSYDARNGQYVGKYQLQEDMLAGDYSPENQEYMAEQYMLDRYGSWEAAREFWDAHGWW